MFHRITSNLRFAFSSAPKHDSQKKGFSSGTAIRANLRIDSRELGHLSEADVSQEGWCGAGGGVGSARKN